MDAPVFSPDLLQELSGALHEYAMAPAGTDDETRLQAATDRVCAEAHAVGMTPEQMVIALKGFYDRVAGEDILEDDRRRTAFDALLSGCIRAYFAAAETPPSQQPI